MREACFTSATLTRFAASIFSGTQVLAQQFKQERKHGLVIVTNVRQRGLWVALLMLAGLAALAAPAAYARTRHSDSWAREHFAAAERMREALNGRPPADRTRRNYQRVLNAYRFVYLGAPTSSKADPSVVATAETLVEMGRRFDDDKILHDAIKEYKFLRREYPGSKYRFDALFTIGEIYKDDLNDPAAARSTFEEVLHRYPHHRLADNARQAIAELDQEAEKAAETPKSARKQPAKHNSNKDSKETAEQDHGSPDVSGKDESSESTTRESPSGRLPRVTAIRHWSTPDYTRIAIDVEGEVKFSSRRIDAPARIFFDLRNTKLASTLVGKSFDVDDGFLKKVRVAQFAPGRTRVVLEVDNLSDYDAFLLPNPYRLVIDIHGKNGRGPQPKGEAASPELASTAALKTAADAEADPNPPEPNPVVGEHAGVATSSGAQTTDTGEEQTSVSVPAAANRKPPTAIVKKVVDADDEDDLSLAQVTKTKTRAARKTDSLAPKNIAAEKTTYDDLDNPDASDSDVSVKSANPGSHPRKSGSHGFVSDKALSNSGASDLDVREARPTASGDRSLIRALGLKIGKIVIDPGHGGHDTGTIGPNGLEEKDLVLEVGRRLGKLLETRLGAEVVYTRRDDTFIPLETRTAIANQARADLFVSIHANSSHDAAARGVETYYLNFTSSPEALEVAARENAVSEKSIYELQDLVKKIALKEKIEESREFAGDVQQSLHSGLATKSPAIRDRGVKKAPFIVLIGANMPSILAEISFVSNPTDEHRLATSEYRQRIAESLYRGIARYVNGLSGVKVASKMDKTAGQ
jgi:N-acetylmuramoyl-L-alanine amidase